MQTRMRCVRMALRADANECKKKRRKKEKTYLDMQTRMRCVRMALRADALYGDVDGGSCRVGADECKEKTKKNTY